MPEEKVQETEETTEKTGKPEDKADQGSDLEEKYSKEELAAMVRKYRAESAGHRIKKNDAQKALEEKAKLWEEYQESQKTEQEKLADAKAKLEAELSVATLALQRRDIAEEFGLDSSLAPLLDGSDEDAMRKKAEILAEKFGKQEDTKRGPDLKAGNRGKPIKKNASDGAEFLLFLGDNLV